MKRRSILFALVGFVLVVGAGWWGVNRYTDGASCDGGQGIRIGFDCIGRDQRSLSTTADGIDDLTLLHDFRELRHLTIDLEDLDGALTGLGDLTSLHYIEISGSDGSDTDVVDLSGLANMVDLQQLELRRVDGVGLGPVTLPNLSWLHLHADTTIDGVPSAPMLELVEMTSGALPFDQLTKAPRLLTLQIRDATEVDWGAVAELESLERLLVLSPPESELGLDDFGFAAGLSNLQVLDINGGGAARDLSPLADLPLRRLDLEGFPIRDLGPISGMTTLEELRLWDAPVTSLQPLASMSSLRSLSLSGSVLRSLDGVEALESLESLDVYESPISDLGPVAGLTSLTWLSLDRSQVNDLTPLAGLSGLTGLSLWGAPVTDLSSLEGLPLITLDLNQTKTESVAPLAGTETLESIRLASTSVTDLGLLRDLPNLDAVVPPEGSGARGRAEVIELLDSVED